MKLGVALFLLVAACGLDTVNPAAVAPQPGMPCGQLGVPCADGACCPQGFTCGGGFPSVGCPADSCCDIGNDLMAARRTPVPKLPAVTR